MPDKILDGSQHPLPSDRVGILEDLADATLLVDDLDHIVVGDVVGRVSRFGDLVDDFGLYHRHVAARACVLGRQRHALVVLLANRSETASACRLAANRTAS